jgi:hypothetical protein
VQHPAEPASDGMPAGTGAQQQPPRPVTRHIVLILDMSIVIAIIRIVVPIRVVPLPGRSIRMQVWLLRGRIPCHCLSVPAPYVGCIAGHFAAGNLVTALLVTDLASPVDR